MAKKLIGILAFAIAIMMLTPVSAIPPATWKKGDEANILKPSHTFDEEYWTAEVVNTTAKGETYTFSVSYVNTRSVQAFLVALKDRKEGNKTETVPWQLFGMHYYTKEKEEVFLGAVLAFLMAYNDTNNNGIPNPGEDKLFIWPFGAGKALNNGSQSYAPQVSAIPVKKLSENAYEFGMTYKNMYAVVTTANPLTSFFWKTGWVAKFSELTIKYRITIDETNGIVKAETYYTLGQITELWYLVLGIPFKLNPKDLPISLGIAVVHYVTMFTSTYEVVENETGNTIDTGIEKEIKKNITIKVGAKKDSRAVTVGFRGTFDLFDEENQTYVEKNKTAYNILLQSRPDDLWLISWQALFSLDVLCLFAWSLSSDLQRKYSSPADMYVRTGVKLSLNQSTEFTASAFWYAVAFPSWRGYRVEHDPTYITYVALNYKVEETPEKKPGICGTVVGLIAIVPIAFGVVVFKRKKNEI